jgi:hypothetical protein
VTYGELRRYITLRILTNFGTQRVRVFLISVNMEIANVYSFAQRREDH